MDTNLTYILLGFAFILFVLSAWLSGLAEFKKIAADTGLKAAVVIAGLASGSAYFFWNKQPEEMDRQLSEAHDTLVNIDIFMSRYQSTIEEIRRDNDQTFSWKDLVGVCLPMKDNCDKHVREATSVSYLDLFTMADYFSASQLENINLDIDKFVEQSGLMKKVLTPELVQSMTDTNFEIILRHKAILELILDMRKKTENISSKFKVKNPDKQKTSRTQDSTSLLVYESCCAILDLNELSDEVKEFYRTQLGNFCKARNMVVQEANAINQDVFTRWFVQKRIKDMQARISNYASSPNDPCKAR